MRAAYIDCVTMDQPNDYVILAQREHEQHGHKVVTLTIEEGRTYVLHHPSNIEQWRADFQRQSDRFRKLHGKLRTPINTKEHGVPRYLRAHGILGGTSWRVRPHDWFHALPTAVEYQVCLDLEEESASVGLLGRLGVFAVEETTRIAGLGGRASHELQRLRAERDMLLMSFAV